VQRLAKVVFLVGMTLLAGRLLAPFRDYAIEGTADGKSLGVITAAEIRSAALTVILSAKRFGSKARVWAAATLSITAVSGLPRKA